MIRLPLSHRIPIGSFSFIFCPSDNSIFVICHSFVALVLAHVTCQYIMNAYLTRMVKTMFIGEWEYNNLNQPRDYTRV